MQREEGGEAKRKVRKKRWRRRWWCSSKRNLTLVSSPVPVAKEREMAWCSSSCITAASADLCLPSPPAPNDPSRPTGRQRQRQSHPESRTCRLPVLLLLLTPPTQCIFPASSPAPAAVLCRVRSLDPAQADQHPCSNCCFGFGRIGDRGLSETQASKCDLASQSCGYL